jgi:hypothetical protein
MGLYQTLYFMSLVGGMSGLFSWGITLIITSLLPAGTPAWLPDLVAATILGTFLGGLTVAFSDRWSGTRVSARWITSGALIGLAAGALAGAVQIPISTEVGAKMPTLARVITWTLAGSLIGLGLGLRWISINRLRVLHACTGGLLGGAVGGIIFAGAGGHVPDLFQALGFVAVGVGICFGITLAPILLRDGILEFVSSGDGRAMSKFGRTHKQWEIQQGDSYLLGSRTQDFTKTMYTPDVQVFIPDAAIAPRHAILFGRDGRFFIARHPDTSDQAGMARFVTRVRGRSVTTSQELRDSDDILVGRTALRFVTRKKEG